MTNKFKNSINTGAPVSDEVERKAAGAEELVMFSARITKEEAAYVKRASFHLNKSKQEILQEALAMYRKKNPVKE